MILFDQLRLSDDAKRLYINVHVNEASYFDNIAIDSITIMTANKVSETDPGTPTEDYIYKTTFSTTTREADLVLTVNDFTDLSQSDMSNTLFFVYVKCKGIVDSCTPCTLDEETTLGVTFDENMLYQRVMDYTKELANKCDVSTGFIDFILLWYAFKAAIETEHYIAAIKYFNMLFDIVDDSGNTVITKSCGCHG